MSSPIVQTFTNLDGIVNAPTVRLTAHSKTVKAKRSRRPPPMHPNDLWPLICGFKINSRMLTSSGRERTTNTTKKAGEMEEPSDDDKTPFVTKPIHYELNIRLKSYNIGLPNQMINHNPNIPPAPLVWDGPFKMKFLKGKVKMGGTTIKISSSLMTCR